MDNSATEAECPALTATRSRKLSTHPVQIYLSYQQTATLVGSLGTLEAQLSTTRQHLDRERRILLEAIVEDIYRELRRRQGTLWEEPGEDVDQSIVRR